MIRADLALILQGISTAAILWMLWRDRKGKPRPGKHRRKRR